MVLNSCIPRAGSRYTGGVADGLRSGEGEIRETSGAIYRGWWIGDEPSGLGTRIEPDGRTYTGRWAIIG